MTPPPAPGSPEAVADKLARMLRMVLPTIEALMAGQGITYSQVEMAQMCVRIVAALEDYAALHGKPAPAGETGGGDE